MKDADQTIFHIPAQYDWELDVSEHSAITSVDCVEQLINQLLSILQSGDQVLIMSNGSFEGIHDRLLSGLSALYKQNIQIKNEENLL